MKLSEAIQIINFDVYDRCITEEEQLEAQMVFWRDLYGVTIKNPGAERYYYYLSCG